MSGERIWVLLGQKTGDNNQLLRLAGALGEPFRTIELRYTALHFLPPALVGASLATLEAKSREQIGPPWPDLVLGIGNRSVPAALAIRERSGGKAKLVRLGNPRLDPRRFDLVITTPQYDVEDAANVIRLPVGISTAPKVKPTREETEWLARLPRPHRLLLIGGDTFMWTLDSEIVAGAASRLAQKPGGSVIATRSPRSADSVVDAAAGALRGTDHAIVLGGVPRYPVLLDDADEIYVTADSVAMVSDAIATGKPVGLVPPSKSFWGRFFYGFGLPVPVRDVRRFWTKVQSDGLAGTIDRPASGALALDPLETAATAVRALL